MTVVRALVLGAFALVGMTVMAVLAGPPVGGGRARASVGDVYQIAGTRFAEPLPASDGDDLSNQPPAEAREFPRID